MRFTPQTGQLQFNRISDETHGSVRTTYSAKSLICELDSVRLRSVGMASLS